MPGSPDPDPISIHNLSFLSIKSIICALSIICLSLEIISELVLTQRLFQEKGIL